MPLFNFETFPKHGWLEKRHRCLLICHMSISIQYLLVCKNTFTLCKNIQLLRLFYSVAISFVAFLAQLYLYARVAVLYRVKRILQMRKLNRRLEKLCVFLILRTDQNDDAISSI